MVVSWLCLYNCMQSSLFYSSMHIFLTYQSYPSLLECINFSVFRENSKKVGVNLTLASHPLCACPLVINRAVTSYKVGLYYIATTGINTGLSVAGSFKMGKSVYTVLYVQFRNSSEEESTSGMGNPCAPHPLNITVRCLVPSSEQ